MVLLEWEATEDDCLMGVAVHWAQELVVWESPAPKPARKPILVAVSLKVWKVFWVVVMKAGVQLALLEQQVLELVGGLA